MVEESGLRRSLMTGSVQLPRIGAVVAGPGASPPYLVVDHSRTPVPAAVQFLQDLALGDASPLTCRSYAYDLLRWFRMLWLLEVEWNRATEAEVALMVGWLRSATNPQRRRTSQVHWRPEQSTRGPGSRR